MRLHIRHATVYRYDQAIEYAVQLIRLRPHDHQGQRVLWWRVMDSERRLPVTDDGYGNTVHMLTLNRLHQEATVVAEGEVETSDTQGVLRDSLERLPPAYYLRTSDVTQPDRALERLAAESGTGAPLEHLHRLMLLIRDRVAYVIGSTTASTSAGDALVAGRGVCQDHAHIFITAARLLGYPARYVSGYLWQGGSLSEASHAWAEAYIAQLGWVGFDPANGISPTEAYVRVAIGLDYSQAAPVRGLRRGLGKESLAVSVDVQQVHSQQ